jgi:hypothetical protein
MKRISELFKTPGYFEDQYKSEQWKALSAACIKAQPYCTCCRRRGVVLNAHHPFYDPGRKLYEYKVSELIVLCKECHAQLTAELRNFRRHVFKHLRPGDFRILNGALAVAMSQYNPTVLVHALAEFVSSPSLVQRYADSWDSKARLEVRP